MKLFELNRVKKRRQLSVFSWIRCVFYVYTRVNWIWRLLHQIRWRVRLTTYSKAAFRCALNWTFSSNPLEGWYVKTQKSESVATDILRSFSSEPPSRTQDNVWSELMTVLMCCKYEHLNSTAELIHHILPSSFSTQMQTLTWTVKNVLLLLTCLTRWISCCVAHIWKAKSR